MQTYTLSEKNPTKRRIFFSYHLYFCVKGGIKHERRTPPLQTPKQLRTIVQIVSGCKKDIARKQKATCQMQVTSLFASYKCYRQPGGERRPAAGWAVLEQHYASYASLQDCSPAAGTALLAASSRQDRTGYRTACGFAALK